MKIKITHQRIWITVCTMLGVLLYLRCVNEIFIYPAIIGGALLIVMCKYEYCLPSLMFTLPFSSIYKFAPGQITFFTIMYLIYIARVLLTRKISTRMILLSASFFLYCIMFSGLSEIITILTMICGFLMISEACRSNDVNFHVCIYAFSFGIIAASLLSLMSGYLPILKNFILEAQLWDSDIGAVVGNRFSGLESNSNYYAFYLIVALSCIAIIMLKEKNSVLPLALFISLSIFGVMTISKTFLIVWAVLLITILIDMLRYNRKKFFTITGLLIVGGLVISAVAHDAISLYLFRFAGVKGQSLSQFTTHRSDLWITYLKAFVNSIRIFLVGDGLRFELLGPWATHNSYIQILYSLGILGTFLYGMFLSTAINLPKCCGKDRLYLLPWIILGINLFAIDALTNDTFPFLITLICLTVLYYKNNQIITIPKGKP